MEAIFRGGNFPGGESFVQFGVEFSGGESVLGEIFRLPDLIIVEINVRLFIVYVNITKNLYIFPSSSV